MSYEQIDIQHSSSGFALYRYKRSRFKDWVVDIADSACEKTGHRLCGLFNNFYLWGEKNVVKTGGPVPIDPEAALSLYRNDEWEWVRESDTFDDPGDRI